jgi:hypothetical protein
MMSVFIPHVFDDVKFEKIAHTFKSLELGVVSRVEWIPKTNSLMGHLQELFRVLYRMV